MSKPRVYFAFRSPYSRLGLHVVSRAGLAVDLIPFTGPPDGVAFSDPVANRPKLAYYMQDAPRMTMRMGLSIVSPKPFDVDFSAANKAAIAAERDGAGLAFAIAVSDARWGRGCDLSDLAVLEACAEDCGWGARAVRAAQSDPSVGEAAKLHRTQIEKDGVFGVPFAVLGDQKFWGHDRFDLFAEAAKAS
jgi:2-hydroxychromene-2-carboxylate isomerase